MRFHDQVVWVTGASSGIGEAVAVAFSREGAQLVLSARNAAELERVRKRCDHADRHLVLPLDLTNEEAIKRAAADVLEQFGRVDVVVHSGGVSQRSLASDTESRHRPRHHGSQLLRHDRADQSAPAIDAARKSGHIVPISSVIGHVGIPLRSAYAASKHALHGFFDTLRAETEKDGIRVTIVCPGYIRTNVSENALRGDGSRYGKVDATHAGAMLPENAAPRILDGIAKNKLEVRVGGKEIWAILLKRFFPGLTSRIVRMK